MKLDEKDLTTLDELIDICIKSVSTSNFTYIEDSDDLLELKEPKYRQTAEWGHFGNGFVWG